MVYVLFCRAISSRPAKFCWPSNQEILSKEKSCQPGLSYGYFRRHGNVKLSKARLKYLLLMNVLTL